MAKEHEPAPDFCKAALEILLKTRETTAALRQQMDGLEVNVWKQAMTEELGRFALSNVDDAQTILTVPKSDKLRDRIRRYTSAYANEMLLSMTWSSLVEKSDQELGELLMGKTVTAKRLSAQTQQPFSLLCEGTTGPAPGDLTEVSGKVVYVDSNFSMIQIHDVSAVQYYTGIPGLEPIGWSIRAVDINGVQLIDLSAEAN